MNLNFNILSEIIRKRRSITPEFYQGTAVSNEILHSVLELACCAPTHKRTQPWRFKVFTQDSRNRLAHFLSEEYKLNTPADKFDETKYKKAGEKVILAACTIALCVERSPDTVIPEWEETAALACAVENMWLGCTSLGLGAYWSTPGSIKNLGKFIPLEENEQCLGFFYIGWTNHTPAPFTRKNLAEVSQWFI